MNDHVTELDRRLARIEATLRALIDTVNPVMSIKEVQQMLGYKTRTPVYAWLKARGIAQRDMGYRRVEVIAAATAERKA